MDAVEEELSDYPEQFSERTRTALDAAVEGLVEALRRHAHYVGGLRGGSSELAGLFEANAEVESLIDAWNERVGDHTGTFPVSLIRPEEDLDDDLEDDSELRAVSDASPISVVSRWDLLVVDVAALVRAGREAHKRVYPGENDEDAAAAVPDAGQALYALCHDAGEPWYDIPGIEVVRGVRAYVRPDEPATPLSAEDDIEATIVEPAGERIFGESWA